MVPVVQKRVAKLLLHQFVLVTNASTKDCPRDRLLADYRQIGSMGSRLSELNSAQMPAVSRTRRGAELTPDRSLVGCHKVETMVLFGLPYKLLHTARRVFAGSTREAFRVSRLRRKLLAVGGLISVSARRATLAINPRGGVIWTTFARPLRTLVPIAERA